MKGALNRTTEVAVNFVRLLKACTNQKDLEKGSKLHAFLREHNLLENHYVANTLVNMYAKCGALEKAQQVFKDLRVRNTVTWNTLIAGHVQQGQTEEALNCYDSMQREGYSPDAITFSCALKACGSMGATAKGKQIHEKIVSLGILEEDIILGSNLVDMYAKCGALGKAEQVLEELPVRDVVMWSSLITGYSEQGQAELALKCFDSMRCEGHCPDAVAFTSVLKACGSIGVTAKGEQIHELIACLGMLEEDDVLRNALVDMYIKCGALEKAQTLLKYFPVQNALSWNSIIIGYVQDGQGAEALNCYDHMQCKGHCPNVVTFICALKACESIQAAAKGEHIHETIIRLGMLEKDVFLGSTLVSMYAKCGAFAKAQGVLEEIPVHDVVMWNAIITGYAQHGQEEESLQCFDIMQYEGQSPDAVSFTCALNACGGIGRLSKGKQIHDKIVNLNILEKNNALATALVDMYAKCGALDKAHKVLQEITLRNVITWNALIAAYAQHNQGEEALKCFDDMQREGHFPDAVSFTCALQACGCIGATIRGEKIHEKILSLGMLEKDIVLGSALVAMYAKCGVLAKAQKVLKELRTRNVITWSVLMAGYVEQGQGEEALKCYDSMQSDGHMPDAITFIYALKACENIGAIAKRTQIHDKIVSLGMPEKDTVLWSTLVNIYARCGALGKAQELFELLFVRDAVTWNKLIAGYVQQLQGEEALKCFDTMQQEGCSPNAVTFLYALKACWSAGGSAKIEQIHEKIVSLGILEKNSVLQSILVDMYSKCGAHEKAQQVLEELPVRHVAMWSALIAGYSQQGKGEKALRCFDSMLCEGHSPDAVTFICALKACGSIGASAKGEEIHEMIASSGLLEEDVVLSNTLVDTYVKCGALHTAQKVVEELPFRGVVTWNAMMAGYIQQGKGKEALKCYDNMQQEGHFPNVVTFSCALNACEIIGAVAKGEEIHETIVRLGILEKDIELANTLLNMYVNCGAILKAQQVFEKLPIRGVGTWSRLIAGYAQQGQGEESLKCYDSMQHEGHSIDVATCISALKACGSIGATFKGRQIHEKVVTLGIPEKDSVVGYILMDMYTKCGAFDDMQTVLREFVWDVVTWTVVIKGYAQQGQSFEALNCFEVLQCKGLKPNSVTLICVLNACSHSGLLDQAEMLFSIIRTRYGITPDEGHYCCMVDLFGRAGKFHKALAVIEKMPSDECLPVWVALLGACHKWREVKIGILAFEHACHLNRSNTAMYVCMADIYTAAGMHEDAIKIEIMRWQRRHGKCLGILDCCD